MPAQRTEDVLSASRSFRDLLLPEPVVRGLEEHGFLRPSPVQQEAIPLARLGSDLIVQAKAGTGKTLVFAVAAVERVDLRLQTPQVRASERAGGGLDRLLTAWRHAACGGLDRSAPALTPACRW